MTTRGQQEEAMKSECDNAVCLFTGSLVHSTSLHGQCPALSSSVSRRMGDWLARDEVKCYEKEDHGDKEEKH